MVDSKPSSLQRNFSRRNIHGQVADKLAKQIVSGELAPGSLLPSEAELSKQLGVSRTALREAIKLMAAKGLLESKRKSGTRVRPRSAWNMLDPDMLSWQLHATPSVLFIQNLFELRLMVEPEAAALAAKRHTEDDIARLREAIDALYQITSDPQAWVEPYLRIYRTVFMAAKNELIDAMGRLAETTVTIILGQPDLPLNVRRSALDRHRLLVNMVATGDADRARSAMQDVIEWTRQSLLALAAEHALDAQPPAVAI